jgi:hypothetical protein
MAFQPDIIVTGADSSEIALVAEARTKLRDVESSKLQLKKFMVGISCPVGLLVTPERLWLFRDQYLASSEDSVTQVAEFDVKSVLNFAQSRTARDDEPAFEQLVQSWLEGLATESGLQALPTELRSAAQLYIVPAVSQGTIRAGHPRLSLSA